MTAKTSPMAAPDTPGPTFTWANEITLFNIEAVVVRPEMPPAYLAKPVPVTVTFAEVQALLIVPPLNPAIPPGE